MLKYHSGVVSKIERGRISASGNPSFWIHFRDGRARVRTETDSQVNHMVENLKEGEWIRYGVNRHGRIVTAVPYDTSGDN
jgi:hypothetical protein